MQFSLTWRGGLGKRTGFTLIELLGRCARLGRVRYNQQQMDEHDWDTFWKVERDICFLFHELSEYPGIRGDLSYGSLYSLPYWEFLNLRGPNIHDDDRCFIRDGCLVMILAMSWDIIDGSGSYLKDKIGLCRQAISELEAEDERTKKLLHVVRLALSVAEQGHSRNDELSELSVWVNYEYVHGYFRRMADESQAEHKRVGAIKRASL